MIKYLGSKRTLIPVLGALAEGSGARTGLDLFTGTTRVAQEFKRRGLVVTANDVATYSAVFSDCWIATDSDTVDRELLLAEVERLNALPGEAGYFTETFCEQSRFFQPQNGARVDAIRNEIEREHRGGPLYAILLTSLILAADRVDSTTGLQMAYLKDWAPRSHKPLQLRVPELLPGVGRTSHGDAVEMVRQLPATDLAYLDPPYNQHRYFTNYHVWETLVRWDEPEFYGVACKRIDARADETRSVFNSKPRMAEAMAELIGELRAEMVVVSYSDESWVSPDQVVDWLRGAGHQRVEMLAYDSRRYVGAKIGIFSPGGKRVGAVSHVRNQEYVFVAGDDDRVTSALQALPE
ncbi:DNA adenine methylase [Nocardioides sp. Bht2]|uniref:DNA adenine methylase n=1 Tax=Nocardioides sp. Bht2 TaxID=3392297 RepID=UPI0039B460E7